jgi:hypothetical protein
MNCLGSKGGSFMLSSHLISSQTLGIMNEDPLLKTLIALGWDFPESRTSLANRHFKDFDLRSGNHSVILWRMGAIPGFEAASHNKSLLGAAIWKEAHWFLLRFWIIQSHFSRRKLSRGICSSSWMVIVNLAGYWLEKKRSTIDRCGCSNHKISEIRQMICNTCWRFNFMLDLAFPCIVWFGAIEYWNNLILPFWFEYKHCAQHSFESLLAAETEFQQINSKLARRQELRSSFKIQKLAQDRIRGAFLTACFKGIDWSQATRSIAQALLNHFR